MPYRNSDIWTQATQLMLDKIRTGTPEKCFYPGRNPRRPANCTRRVVAVNITLAVPLPYCRRHISPHDYSLKQQADSAIPQPKG